MATGVVDRLRIEITSTVSKASKGIDSIIKDLDKLSTSMAKSPKGAVFKAGMKIASQGIKEFQADVKKVIGHLGTLGSKMLSASKQMLGLNNSFGLLGKSSSTVTSKFATLASKIGLAYAALFPLMKLFSGFKKLTGLAADLTEVQNVVDVAFGDMRNKVEDFSKTSIQEFGLSEIAAKKFASQYQAMGNAMGITGDQVKSATGFLQKFKTVTGDTSGYDKTSSSMADLSINLTKLTSDMSSFYNVEQETIAKALQSGIMAGNTRPLRTYGLDLTQATLAEWAMKQGLDADIKSMTQAEKTMLRYQYVMANTAMAQGDFARTADTWANTVRTIKQEFEQLGITIGKGLTQAFKPFLKSLKNILAQVIAFVEAIYNALGQIFGWKVTVSSGGISKEFTDAYKSSDATAQSTEEASDNTHAMAQGLGTASKNAKELNKQLQGFDKLNNLTTSTKSSGSSGGSGGSGGGSGGGGAGGVDADAGIGGITTKLTEIETPLKSGIKTLYELGRFMGETLRNALNDIPWNKVYTGASGFGKGLAEYLNGLVETPGLFDSVGRTIANALNTALHFLDGFGTEFHWDSLGTSLGEGINSFFGNFDWGEWIHVNATFGKGFAEAFNAAVRKINFEKVGEGFSKFIQGLITRSFALATEIDLSTFGKKLADLVNGAIKNAPVELAGATISTWSTKILNGLILMISNIKWEMIPKKIAEFVRSLKLGEVGNAFGVFVKSMVDALGRLLSDTKNWTIISKEISNGVNSALNAFGATGFAKAGKSLGKIVNWIVDTLSDLDWKSITEGISRFLDEAIQEINWGKLGSLIGRLMLSKFSIKAGVVGSVIKKAFATAGKSIDSIDLSGLEKAIKKGLKGIGKYIAENFDIFKWIQDAFKNVGEKIDGLFQKIPTEINWEKIREGIGKGLKSLLGFGGNGKKATADASVVVKATLEKQGSGWKDIAALSGKIVSVPVKLAKKGWKSLQSFAGGDVWAYVKRKIKSGQKNLQKGFGGDIWAYVKRKLKGGQKKLQNGFGGDIWAYVKRKLKSGQKKLQSAFGGDIWAYVKRKLKSGQEKLQEKFGGDIWAYVKRTLANGQKSLQEKFGGTVWAYVKRTLASGQRSLQDAFGGIVKAFVKRTPFGKAEGGVFANGKWSPIQQYASGGLPGSAEVFVAREAGPELVGTIGGHTGVMNNDQIVASVSNGVAKAMSESNAILRQQNRILTNILAKEFGISSRDVFNAVRSENQNYINRTGNNAFAL